jgi:hypothetical protein
MFCGMTDLAKLKRSRSITAVFSQSPTASGPRGRKAGRLCSPQAIAGHIPEQQYNEPVILFELLDVAYLFHVKLF